MSQPDTSGEVAEDLPVLDRPADGIPDVVNTPEAMTAAVAALRAGDGPIALDAERAQGYRYGAEAYLIQLRRHGSGTHLVDPRAFADKTGRVDLAELNDAIRDATWILHAASQDLACLSEAGLRPTSLFDTELAARLLHHERVGLGAIIEAEFGLRLLKEHSAADWSRRPLPVEWLNYAALDVELLIPLAEKLQAELRQTGKEDWADQEFEALVAGVDVDKPERVDPWRRLHGLSQVKQPAGLALARELWAARDELARRLDKGPSRILPDAAITELAARLGTGTPRWPSRADLRSIEGFRRRQAQRFEANWLAAIDRVAAAKKATWPPKHVRRDEPSPQPRNWQARHPDAYDRWLAVRPAVNDLADRLDVPAENLLSPAVLRAVAWQPAGSSTEDIRVQLMQRGARRWQANECAPVIAEALRERRPHD